MAINGIGGPPAHAASQNRPANAAAPQKLEEDSVDVASDTSEAVSKGRSAEAPAQVVKALLAENAATASVDGTEGTFLSNLFGKLVSALARGEDPQELLAASTAQKEEETEETAVTTETLVEKDIVV